MIDRRRLPLLLFLLLLIPGPVRGQSEKQLTRFREMEDLARKAVTGKIGGEKVDVRSGKELSVLSWTLDDPLEFPSLSSSIEKERDFQRKWLETYEKAIEALVGDARKLSKKHDFFPAKWNSASVGKFLQLVKRQYGRDRIRPPKSVKKGPEVLEAWRDCWTVLPRAFPRYAEIYKTKKMTGRDLSFRFKERKATAERYLKRYDLGPKMVETKLEGSALLWVELSPRVRNIVEDYLDGLKAPRLTDAEGNALEWEGRKLHFQRFPNLIPALKKALDELTGEFFIIRYAVREGDKVTDVMRVTGGRLLLGEFFFFEIDDKMIISWKRPK